MKMKDFLITFADNTPPKTVTSLNSDTARLSVPESDRMWIESVTEITNKD